MGSVLRFILRLVVVPTGLLAAVVAAILVVGFSNWIKLNGVLASNLGDAPNFWAMLFVLFTSATVAVSLVPGLVGVVVSEVVAIRSIILHALNGGVSMWIGWTTIGGYVSPEDVTLDDLKTLLAAGFAAGFAYWAVAGWSAGFWKPVFAGNQANMHR